MKTMTNGEAAKIPMGSLVKLPDGSYGRVEYTKGSTASYFWVGVRQDKRVDEWQPQQLVRV